MSDPHPSRSLSFRLLWVTVGVVLITEVLIFFPSLGHERRAWLERHIREANIAALAVGGAPHGVVDAKTRDDLLHLSGDAFIRLRRASGVEIVLASPGVIAPSARYDLRHESLLAGMGYALADLFRSGDRPITVIGNSPLRPATVVELIMHERELLDVLHEYAWQIADLSLVIAIVTGGLVYLAMLMLLVQPIRRITHSIAAFRADPERGTPLDPVGISLLGDDEMAVAGRELAAMQQELRAALWRNARLAALGTAMAKISHDLRGILTSAMLAAERLTDSGDPRLSRSGDVLMRALERASDLACGMLDFVREGPPSMTRDKVLLRPLLAEVHEAVLPVVRGFAVDNHVADDFCVEADRAQIFRVFVNLLRNAAEAGARRTKIRATPVECGVEIMIEDDGPGLPEPVRAHLFRPFVSSFRHGGTGLGLAIARDLMRAHGGDLTLAATGPGGTTFRLTLPSAPLATEPSETPAHSAVS